MAPGQDAPYRPQDPHEVSTMLGGLERNMGRGKGPGGFSAKKNTFTIEGSGIKVDSWKMQEWDYKRPNLPTYARGLFTTTNSQGNAEIVTRGYDKFFNHGEVHETEWRYVNQDTRGPYELSVKENGCIIFVSGLEDGTLLVCSKHSTGPRSDAEASHAVAGEKWIERHLATVGRTKRDLAMKLRAMNATAVGELCDDEFEEHVLAYTPESAGLYLHGINLNTPEFATYPHHLVDRFAEEWGMKKTMYIVKDNIQDVKEFLDGVAETGNYDGRDTEGFVIRCQSKANTNVWHDWFFKYKFEEPYLMYRQWRECTKAVISNKEPKYKKHKKITEEYITFARRQLHGKSQLADAYQHNHGIIKMRDDFLAFRGLNGADIIRQEQESGDVGNEDVMQDVVLVPVATIGCGKTTVALGLVRLFGWGHVQNDNITVKKGKPAAFAQACTGELTQANAMIADRNNHQRRERKQLIEDVSKIVPNARFVALHYTHDKRNYDSIRHATRSRVLERGDNHQTIQAKTKGGEIIGIMEGFMDRFEPVNLESPPDDGFDTVINLDPTRSSRENLEIVITSLYTEYPRLFAGREMPSSDDMDAAIQAALTDYTVDIKHEIKDNRQNKKQKQKQQPPQQQNGKAQKERGVEYFAVQLPATRVQSVLDAVFSDTDPETADMYQQLKYAFRVQSEFHVTLIHKASASANQEIWNNLLTLHSQAVAANSSDPKVGHAKVRLERLVWDRRVMCFVVRLAPGEGSSEEWKTVNPTAHVTVGTIAKEVKPKESNDLLAKWLREGSEGTGIREVAVRGAVELEGAVRGVLSR